METATIRPIQWCDIGTYANRIQPFLGIPFPRDDGVCTKFPTEVILEHADTPRTIVATIIPHASRSEASKTTLQAFRRVIDDFSELPDVIAAAGALLGIR